MEKQIIKSDILKEEIKSIVQNGLMEMKYRNIVDRETAFEKLEDINEELLIALSGVIFQYI